MKTNNLINTKIANLSISQRLIWIALKCVSKKTKYGVNSNVVKNLRKKVRERASDNSWKILCDANRKYLINEFGERSIPN